MGKEVVGKNNNSEEEVFVADGSRWNFLRQGLPDFLKDPWGKVARFVDSLPFSDEVRSEILDLIRSKREDKGVEKTDASS